MRLWGELGYDYRLERLEEAKVNEHRGIFRINGATFIARPWIAQVVGGIGLAYRNADASTGDREGLFLDGDIALRVFPSSPFPFRAFLQVRDSEQDDLELDRDTVQTRYGFLQSYTSRRIGSFRLGYTHNDLEQKTVRTDREVTQKTRDTTDDWRFDYNHGIGRHDIRFNASHVSTDRGEGRQDTSRLFSILRHSYSRGPELSVENRLTYSRDVRESQPDLTFVTPTIEFNSIGFWRPKTERPLLVNGFVRVRDSSTESGRGRSNNQIANVNAGFNYQWKPRWQVTGDASAVAAKREGGDDFRTLQRLRLRYTSRNYKVGRYDYAWFGGPAVSNRSAKDEDLQAAGLDFGQGLDRTFLLSARSHIVLDLRQSISLIEDTDGRSVQTLRHGGDVAWANTGPRRSQRARFAISDTRTFGGGGRQGSEEREFQRISFQASINHLISRFSSIRGDVIIQTTRTVSPRNEDVEQGQTTDGAFLPSASIDITYSHGRVFRVPRLWFRSKLRFFSDSYFPQLDEPTGTRQREQIIWDNRLEYAIGLLRLRLLGRYNQSLDADNVLLLFQVRRLFGRF